MYTGDEIFRRLLKYDFDECRQGKDIVEYLEEHFKRYISDIKEALELQNEFLGNIFCQELSSNISVIENSCKLIVDVISNFNKGNIKKSYDISNELFDSMSEFYILNMLRFENEDVFYRIRAGNFTIKQGDNDKKNKEQLFHIKNKDRHLIGAYRYSVAGLPCLYVATGIELAWFESGMPKKFSYCAMKLNIDDESKRLIKFIDFTNRPIDFLSTIYTNLLNYRSDENIKKKIYKDLLNYIITYPLVIACSLKVENRGEKFVQEYILPQMLMHWIREKDDYYGVKYKSALNTEHVGGMGAYNIAFPVKEFREDGLCKVLTSMISISDIRYLDIDKEFDEYKDKLIELKRFKKDINFSMVCGKFNYKYGMEIVGICDAIDIAYNLLIYGKNENLRLILQQIECLANYIYRIESNKEDIIKNSIQDIKKYSDCDEIELSKDILNTIEKFNSLAKSIVQKNIVFRFNVKKEFENGDLI